MDNMHHRAVDLGKKRYILLGVASARGKVGRKQYPLNQEALFPMVTNLSQSHRLCAAN